MQHDLEGIVPTMVVTGDDEHTHTLEPSGRGRYNRKKKIEENDNDNDDDNDDENENSDFECAKEREKPIRKFNLPAPIRVESGPRSNARVSRS